MTKKEITIFKSMQGLDEVKEKMYIVDGKEDEIWLHHEYTEIVLHETDMVPASVVTGDQAKTMNDARKAFAQRLAEGNMAFYQYLIRSPIKKETLPDMTDVSEYEINGTGLPTKRKDMKKKKVTIFEAKSNLEKVEEEVYVVEGKDQEILLLSRLDIDIDGLIPGIF